MSRPLDGYPHLGATLARLLSEERPEWVSAPTQRAARALLDALRDDATGALADGPSAAAEALGVGRATLARWRESGWLAQKDEQP